jgi:hypothetical protein
MRKTVIGLLVALFLVASAQAGTVYLNSSTFLAQLQPGYYLENFQGIGLNLIGSPKAFSSGGFSYTASATSGLYGLYVPGSGTDVALSIDSYFDPLVFTFTSGNVTAVGGYFFPTDASEALVSGSLGLTLSDATAYTLVNGTPTSFVGFTTAPGVWITSLTVSGVEPGRYPTVNDLYVGQAGGGPEPATGALLGGGALLLAGLARWRK